jgi:hypothetical protein
MRIELKHNERRLCLSATDQQPELWGDCRISASSHKADTNYRGSDVRFAPQREMLAPHSEYYARLRDHRETKALIEPSSRIVLEDFEHNLLPVVLQVASKLPSI